MFKNILIAVGLICAIPQTSFAQGSTLSNLIQMDGNTSCHPDGSQDFGVKQNGWYAAEFEIYRGAALIETSPNVLLGQCWYLSRFHGVGLTVKGFAYTGLVWNPRIQFMEIKTRGTHYVETYGTTLDPRARAMVSGNPAGSYNTTRYIREITERK